MGVEPCLSGMAAQAIPEQAILLSHWVLVETSACYSLHAGHAVVVLTRLSVCRGVCLQVSHKHLVRVRVTAFWVQCLELFLIRGLLHIIRVSRSSQALL